MDISRKLALEIFGLQDGKYTEKDLSDAYRKLAKVTHPDSGGETVLFRFVQECKEILEKGVSTSTDSNHKKYRSSGYTKQDTREEGNLSLEFVNQYFLMLHTIVQKYRINLIIASAKVCIYPIFRKSKQICLTISPTITFDEFLRVADKNFYDIITLPENFEKIKRFKVHVEFLGKPYKFLVKRNTTISAKHTAVLEPTSILNLTLK